MEKKPIIKFALAGIKTEQFAFFPEKFQNKQQATITSGIHLKLNPVKHRIGVFYSADFIHGKNKLVTLQVSCHFKIHDDSWPNLESKKDNRISFDKDVIAHLAMITVGTARGILFAKLEGSPLSQLILPTINLKEIINADAIFEIQPGTSSKEND